MYHSVFRSSISIMNKNLGVYLAVLKFKTAKTS